MIHFLFLSDMVSKGHMVSFRGCITAADANGVFYVIIIVVVVVEGVVVDIWVKGVVMISSFAEGKAKFLVHFLQVSNWQDYEGLRLLRLIICRWLKLLRLE